MPKVSLELAEPVAVAQSPPEIRQWGPYQFPGLTRLLHGRIQLSFHVEAVSSSAYGLPPVCAVLADEGRTWELLPRDASGQAGSAAWDAELLLSNGDRLRQATLRSRPVGVLTLPRRPWAECGEQG